MADFIYSELLLFYGSLHSILLLILLKVTLQIWEIFHRQCEWWLNFLIIICLNFSNLYSAITSQLMFTENVNREPNLIQLLLIPWWGFRDRNATSYVSPETSLTRVLFLMWEDARAIAPWMPLFAHRKTVLLPMDRNSPNSDDTVNKSCTEPSRSVSFIHWKKKLAGTIREQLRLQNHGHCAKR